MPQTSYLSKTSDSASALQVSVISYAEQNFTLHTLIKNVIQCFFLLALLIVCLITRPALAQSNLDPQKMAAVMSVINMYLLSDEVKLVELSLNQFENRGYSFTDEFEVTFPGESDDLEFCFVLSQFDADMQLSINDGDLWSLHTGENCFLMPLGSQLNVNSAKFLFPDGKGRGRVSLIGSTLNDPSSFMMSSLKRSTWDERAVRKVLKIFAFGGHATDAQIQTWSNFPPNVAIQEMLNFDETNPKLSSVAGEKYTEHTQAQVSVDVLRSIYDEATMMNIEVTTQEIVRPGTLYGWQQYMRARNTSYPVPAVVPRENDDPSYPRDQYGIDGYNFDDAYNRMITVRGLNPFRQRIGFWETNYHLATNLDAGVSRRQMAIYYDEIMDAHAAGLAYKDVMGVAAKTAAVAMQYGHRNNEWNSSTGECDCNEDFAREIHQLYYGIFGDHDPFPGDGISGPDYHENTTIPNSAKMLTDMPVRYINSDAMLSFTGFNTEVTFETDDHHVPPLTILGQTVVGANASQKIDSLMPISMQHPESLSNLPIMIISVLANDNLTEANKTELRASWASMGVNRNFLDFIRAYATSEQFHSTSQFKYLTTHERALYMANKHNLDNIEAYFGGGYYNGDRLGRSVGGIVSDEAAGDFFEPLHNVFGGQTSTEASDSALIFEKNYNALTDQEQDMRRVGCDECDLGQPWEKPWNEVLPKRGDGQYYVEDIALWLWKHVVGHLDNFTELERAHLYALLGATRVDLDDDNDGDYPFDFNLVMCVVKDYQAPDYINDPGRTDAPILAILTDGTWDDHCRDSNGPYEQHEIDALNAQLSGLDIANDLEMQDVLNQLGQVTLRLNATTGFRYASSEELPPNGGLVPDGGANVRKHAREAVNSALGFIYATPFIFAEGE